MTFTIPPVLRTRFEQFAPSPRSWNDLKAEVDRLELIIKAQADRLESLERQIDEVEDENEMLEEELEAAYDQADYERACKMKEREKGFTYFVYPWAATPVIDMVIVPHNGGFVITVL